MTKFGLFLAALRNVKSFPIRVVPGHRRVAGRIHFREFTTPQKHHPTAKISSIPYSHVLLCYGCHQL